MELPQYANQVAGKTTIVSIFDDHLLKPTCEIEYKHYKTLAKTNAVLFACLPFCCFVVHDGKVSSICARDCQTCSRDMEAAVETLAVVARSGYYIVLHDIAFGMISPRIIDIKLGHRTWGDDKTEKKKKEMAAKDAASTSATLAIRLSGCMQTIDGQVQKLGKATRGVFTDEQLTEHLKSFFNSPKEQVHSALLQTEVIKQALKSSEGWRFIGASVLFLINEKPQETFEGSVCVKLIDLAHTSNSSEYKGYDKGAVTGLENIQKVLEEKLRVSV